MKPPEERSRAPELPIGEVVGGRYEVLRLLGRGGMGSVYAVADPLQGEVALKVVGGALYAGPEGRLRFKREFHTMALLRHPNTLAVHDLGELTTSAGELLYYSMELFPGRDLDRIGRLSTAALGRVLVEVARALGFIHARGHVHRDLKPQNVRLRTTPERPRELALKLMDFGLMEPIGARRRGHLLGTPSFVAPEVVRGEAIDGRADLFALGAMAYWLLTGHRPFPSDSIVASARLAERPPAPPSSRAEGHTVPPALDQLILELCAANPAERPASAEEVLARLGPIFGIGVELGPAARRSYLVASEPVGRARELAELGRLLQSARAGTGGAALLVAPAGLGKSRLLEALALQAQLEGFRVARTSAQEGGHAPFETLQRAMRPLVVTTPMPDAAPAAGPTPPPRERLRGLRTLLDLVGRLAEEQPLCLIVDELPRADTASSDALAALAMAAPTLRLVVVAAGRTEEVLAQSGLRLSAWEGVPRLELTAFGPAEVERLVRALFGRIEVPPTFVRDLHEQGGGNPYHLTELLRTLVDDGVIVQAAGRFVLPAQLEPRSGTTAAASLDAALLRRVGRQGPEARQLMDLLAVLDRQVALPLLVAMAAGESGPAEGHELQVFAALDTLLAAGILEQQRREGEGDTPRYGFHHPRLREVLYRELDPARRAVLHRRAAGTLIDRHAGHEQEHAAELGHHLARSPELPERLRGARLLLLAGRAHFEAEAYADARGPHLEALDILEEALAAPGRDADRPGLEALRLDAWETLSRIGLYSDFALADQFLARLYRHHRAQAGLPGDGDARRRQRQIGAQNAAARLAAPVGAALDRGYLLARALGRFGRLMVTDLAGSTRAALAPLERFFLTTTYRATVLADLGRFTEALALAEELRPMVLSPGRMEAGAYQLARVTALSYQGHFGAAVQVCDLADAGLSERRAGLDPYDLAMGETGVLFTRAVSLAFRGHPGWRAEQARLQQAADGLELDFAQMTARVVTVVASCIRGDRNTAQQTLASYLAHYRTLGRPAHAFRVYPWMALVELEAGHLTAARAHLETYRQSAPAGYFREGLGAYVEGELLLAAGDPAAAAGPLGRALAWARDPSAASVLLESRSRLALAEVALQGDRPDEAVTQVEQVLQLSATASSRCERDRVRARRLLGRARLAQGDLDQARPELQAARLLCHAVDSPLEQALTHCALATLAERCGQWVAEGEHRHEAERCLQGLGQEVLAARLRPRPTTPPPEPALPETARATTRPDRPRRR